MFPCDVYSIPLPEKRQCIFLFYLFAAKSTKRATNPVAMVPASLSSETAIKTRKVARPNGVVMSNRLQGNAMPPGSSHASVVTSSIQRRVSKNNEEAKMQSRLVTGGAKSTSPNSIVLRPIVELTRHCSSSGRAADTRTTAATHGQKNIVYAPFKTGLSLVK